MAGGSAEVPAQLNRASFEEDVPLTALRLAPRQCSDFMKRLSGHVLKRPKIKPIVACEDGGRYCQIHSNLGARIFSFR